VLASINANSEIAKKVLSEDVAPSFVQKPHLSKTFLRDSKYQVSDNGMLKMICKLDVNRFLNSITSIARGLYYHHTWYSYKALGPMKITWGAAKEMQVALQALNLSDKEYVAFTTPSPSQPKCPLGENPRVFRYGFDFKSDPNHVLCYMRFYEGEAICVRWENGQREYTTKLKSLADFLKNYVEVKIGSTADLSEAAREDVMRQLEEQDAKLVIIMKDARHQRDFGGFSLARLIREDIGKKKKLLNGEKS
jgi:hypothetical protein